MVLESIVIRFVRLIVSLAIGLLTST